MQHVLPRPGKRHVYILRPLSCRLVAINHMDSWDVNLNLYFFSNETSKQAETKPASTNVTASKKPEHGAGNSVGGSDMTSLQGLPSLNKDKGSSMSSLMGAPPLDSDRQGDSYRLGV